MRKCIWIKNGDRFTPGCASERIFSEVPERCFLCGHETEVADWHDVFASAMSAATDEIHAQAVEKGWWPDDEGINHAEKIALIHAELSEALEALREACNPPLTSKKIPPYNQAEEELADAIIRILDLAGAAGWDIGAALVAKHAYNRGRQHRHGNKCY